MVAEKLKASLQPGSPAEILLYRTHQQLQARRTLPVMIADACTQLLAQVRLICRPSAARVSAAAPGPIKFALFLTSSLKDSEMRGTFSGPVTRRQPWSRASSQVLTSYRTRVDDLRMANLSLLNAEPASPVAAPPQIAAAANGVGRGAATGEAASAAKNAQLAASMRDMRSVRTQGSPVQEGC